jgi:hypothetical protein
MYTKETLNQKKKRKKKKKKNKKVVKTKNMKVIMGSYLVVQDIKEKSLLSPLSSRGL